MGPATAEPPNAERCGWARRYEASSELADVVVLEGDHSARPLLLTVHWLERVEGFTDWTLELHPRDCSGEFRTNVLTYPHGGAPYHGIQVRGRITPEQVVLEHLGMNEQHVEGVGLLLPVTE